jgi:NOL1/NOP2/fmu family ribosome biogenesis protein
LPAFVSAIERKEILDYFFDRFGIPGSAFDGFRFLKEKKTLYAAADAFGLENILENLKVEAAGVPLLRLDSSLWKPTAAGLQLFGAEASRNILELDDDRLEVLLQQGRMDGPLPFAPGYVILRWQGNILGCGLYGRRGLRSHIPEGRFIHLKRNNLP